MIMSPADAGQQGVRDRQTVTLTNVQVIPICQPAEKGNAISGAEYYQGMTKKISDLLT